MTFAFGIFFFCEITDVIDCRESSIVALDGRDEIMTKVLHEVVVNLEFEGYLK